MSKGLEATKRLKWGYAITREERIYLCECIEKELKEGEKAQFKLKALGNFVLKSEVLEIIINKKVNLEYLKCCENYEQYKTICSYWNEITKQEFDLLKEVML